MASIFEATAGSAIGPTNGGTVTQATNKATAVTLNTESGQITLASAELAGAAEVTFLSTTIRSLPLTWLWSTTALPVLLAAICSSQQHCCWFVQDHCGERWFDC